MDYRTAWERQTAKLAKKKKAKKPAEPLERDVQKAGIEAFAMTHRIHLKPMDAGGQNTKGLVAVFPQWLREGLGLPKHLPFGLEAWIHVPPDFPDTMGRNEDGCWVFIEWKRKGAKPSAGQLRYIDTLQDLGAIAFWADSVDSALEQYGAQAGLL